MRTDFSNFISQEIVGLDFYIKPTKWDLCDWES